MQRCLDLLKDRGPDGEGIWSEGDALLGHRRLRVLDLSEAADQPLRASPGGPVITFNGEIYNYREIRTELEQQGHHFHSTGDTEVLLRAYEAWGMERLLERLDGMYAIAIWDPGQRELHLATDPYGKKPLHYARRGKKVSFASTIPSLLALLPDRAALSPTGLYLYLAWMAIPAPWTAYEDVWKVPPGTWIRATEDGWDERCYVQHTYEPTFRGSFNEAVDEAGRLLTLAVQKRLQSDVPVGAFLSGGIDSGLVVGRMARLMSRTVDTFTVGFAGGPDERDAARGIAKRFQTSHNEVLVDESSVLQLPDLIAGIGEPLGDPSLLPTLAVAAAARSRVTVALNGDGGDELFLGYSRPLVANIAGRLRSLPAGLLHFGGDAANWSLKILGPRRRVRQLAELMRVAAGDDLEVLRYRRAFWGHDSALSPEFVEAREGISPDCDLAAITMRMDGWHPVHRALAVDVQRYLSPQLLSKMDRMTMAVSLEARSPFLDKGLGDFTRTLPLHILLPGTRTKAVLRSLFEREIDPKLANARKTGFAPPVATWLAGRLGADMEAGWRNPGHPLWRVMNQNVLRSMLADVRRGRPQHTDRVWTAAVLGMWLEGGAGALPWGSCLACGHVGMVRG